MLKKIKVMNGAILEFAVELIETHVLKEISKSDIVQVKVERNKIFTISEVRHEVDIYVTIDLKIGTKLIYIFECKNYSKMVVSKNDIIIFEKKIELLNAQKGFFVARRFGRDSENMAKQNARIELLLVKSDDEIFGHKSEIHIHSLLLDNCSATFKLNPPIQISSDFEFLPIKISGKNETSINMLIREKISKRSTSNEDHEITTSKKEQLLWNFTLKYENPIINNKQFDSIIIDIEATFKLLPSEIIYSYDLDKKGSYIKVRMVDYFNEISAINEFTKINNEIMSHAAYIENPTNIKIGESIPVSMIIENLSKNDLSITLPETGDSFHVDYNKKKITFLQKK